MNNVVLVGRLVRDPELKHIKETGKAVTKCVIAVSRDYKNSNNEREADYIPVTFWGRTAEIVCEYLSKGSLISVSGKIRIESYDDKEGNKKYSTDIMAENLQFLDSKEKKEKVV